MSSIKYTTKKNIIALIDCNSFYVSCERLFKPKIQKRAVVVLSNNDGCVISRSQEAKDMGIKMGEHFLSDYFKDFITRNKIEVYSSNYALYGDISRRVMKVLKTFSPKVEIYSIDEAFIDLSFMDHEGIEEYGRQIRSRILRWTGIPTSVGIASTKTLSKVANHIAKKEKTGVVYLKKDIDEKLKKFPIEKVWGGPNSGLDGGKNDGYGISNTPGGIKLQSEGFHVLYRNIWIQKLDINDPDTDF